MHNSITDIFPHCMILVEINIIFNEIDLSLALFLSNFCLTEKAMGEQSHFGVNACNYHISTGVYFVLLIRNCLPSEPV